MRYFLTLLSLFTFTISVYAQTPKLVHDAWPGPTRGVGTAGNLIQYNGWLYYVGNSLAHGQEPWRYNGISTPADIDYAPGSPGSMGDATAYMTTYKGKLIMAAGKTTTGYELTSFDGSSFTLIQDIIPGPTSSRPRYFTEWQDKGLLFFTADSQYSGGIYSELYRYDGINVPRRIQVNDGTNPAGSQPIYMQPLGNYMYFSAMPSTAMQYKLYRAATDGTFTPAKGAKTLINPGDKLVVGDTMYFTAYETATGNELYKYDGDTAIRITDIAVGPLNGASYDTGSSGIPMRNTPTLYHGSIYFTGSADGINYQLYAYSPVSGKAALVHTVNPTGNGKVSNLYVYKNALYFTAWTPSTGLELWRFNDTTCVLYADIWPGPKSGMTLTSGPAFPDEVTYAAFAEFKGDLYFKAQDSLHGRELWRIQAPVTTGVQQASFNGRVSVFPNPATFAVTLAITLTDSRKLKIVVSDIAGREVFSTSSKLHHAGEERVSIPMQQLSQGQYVYRVVDDSGSSIATGVITRQ